MKNWRGRSEFVAKLGQLPLVCLLALGVDAAFIGCASEPLSNVGGEQSGSLGLSLEAAPGVTLDAVAYIISGNGFSKTGSIDSSGATTISGTIGGIRAGKGYVITLTAKSLETGTTFSGSATFDVIVGGTTSVTIQLRSAGTSGNGSVSVNGTLNLGPAIEELTVTPQDVFVGRRTGRRRAIRLLPITFASGSEQSRHPHRGGIAVSLARSSATKRYNSPDSRVLVEQFVLLQRNPSIKEAP